MTCSREYYTVMRMKRFFLSLLVITMLTPMLVCSGMTFDINKSQAAQCHEQEMDYALDGIMFMSDCMQVDLFSIDGGDSVQKPDQSFELVSYDISYLAAGHRFLDGLEKARAPPGYETRATSLALPIILTTQRFLI